MPIIFEGPPPYEPLFAKSASSKPTLDGVELVLNVTVGEFPHSTVPVRIVLEPPDATALARQIGPVAMTVENWRRNQKR